MRPRLLAAALALVIGSMPVAVLVGGRADAARRPHAAVVVPINRLTHIAKRRFGEEVYGVAVHRQVARVAHDPALIRALAAGDMRGLRRVVAREQATPHVHISRLRVVRGRRVLADSGVVFVVAPAQRVLRDARGRNLGTLQVSLQDVIGFVRYMHRNFGVDVVARGSGPKHVRSSWRAALHVHLPDRGSATILGRRYAVRSFTRRALGGEAVKIWILARA